MDASEALARVKTELGVISHDVVPFELLKRFHWSLSVE